MNDDEVNKLDEKMRIFANLILDRIIDDWNNGKLVNKRIKTRNKNK